MNRGVAVLASAAAILLSGCLGAAEVPGADWLMASDSDVEAASSPWTEGSYWTYRATFSTGTTIDVSLVVDEVRDDGYALGTNLSAGFFGLPFQGEVTADHNPVVAGKEWPLYAWPLEDGKTWEYTMLGHPVKARAEAATVHAPGVGDHQGFLIKAQSYGRTFATYTYSPATGWFTSLTLTEPSNGRTVLDVHLTGHGDAYDEPYFVHERVAHVTAAFPAVGGEDVVLVPTGAPLTAILVIEADPGVYEAALVDPEGRTRLDARSLGTGSAVERETLDGAPGWWRLTRTGAGVGAVSLELTALVPSDGVRDPTAARSDVPDVDLDHLLSGPAPGDGTPTLPLL